MGLHAVHTDRSIVSVPDREKGLYHLLRIHFVIEYSTTTVRPITKLIKVEYKRGDRWVGMAYVAGGYGRGRQIGAEDRNVFMMHTIINPDLSTTGESARARRETKLENGNNWRMVAQIAPTQY